MKAICFHGRRERDMSGDFLIAAQILGEAAIQASLFSQVRTPTWASTPGSPDRAIVRVETASINDMVVPRQYALEVVCDPTLAVIPPMGNALLPGGVLIVNSPDHLSKPPDGLKITCADLTGLALGHAAPLSLALSSAAGAALGKLSSDFSISLDALEGASSVILNRSIEEGERRLLHEAYQTATGC